MSSLMEDKWHRRQPEKMESKSRAQGRQARLGSRMEVPKWGWRHLEDSASLQGRAWGREVDNVLLTLECAWILQLVAWFPVTDWLGMGAGRQG